MANRKISKLGLKFILFTLLPALLVIIIAGIVCYCVVSQNKIGIIKQEVLQQASVNNDDVEDALFDLYETAELEQGYGKVYNYINNSDSVQDLYFYNQATKFLDGIVNENDKAVHSAWIASFKSRVMISDEKNGYKKDDVKEFTKLPWYDPVAIHVGKMYFSPIYTSEIGNNNRVNKVVNIIVPIKDKMTEEVIGAYGIEVSMLYIDPILKLDNDFSDALVFMFNENNKLLYYSGARTESDYTEIHKVLDNFNLDGYSYEDFNGKQYLSMVTSMNNMHWTVDYLIRKDEIKSSVNKVALPMMVTFICAALILSIVMIAFISRFVSKVRLVISNTMDISNGKYNNRMLIDSDDEFGELAVAFNDTIDKLKYMAEHDDITGVYNVSTFYNIADRLIKQIDSVTGKYAIVRLDIDHFRIINDIYNWQVGNNVLLHIADSITKRLPNGSVCGRLSGDIFVICMKYTSIEGLENILASIKDDILAFDIIVNLNPHFGVYLDAERDIPIYLLCDRAGIALGMIKGNLLSTISYYDNTINRKNMDIKFIETNMQAALDDKQFFVQLQPKYNMQTNEIVGAEALVRWKNPEKGILRPDLFIPVFEKNGFVIKLDEFVWEETCKLLKKWKDIGLKSIPISVNVSRVHIYDKNFISNLCALIEKYDIPVEMLELEFTESALLDDVKELYRLMNQLKEKKFALLMDDFASGYSSLNTLKSAPFDIVKIDKEFISAICESDRDRILVASTISMINNQNMQIVVEGVEKHGQVEILKAAGCSIAQGYFYSKPVDIDVFEKMAFGIE